MHLWRIAKDIIISSWRTNKFNQWIPEEFNKLVPEELINLIYEFLKNSINLVPEELINLIYEFPKNSINGLVPKELRKYQFLWISDEFNIPTFLKDCKLIVIYYVVPEELNG
jgi:hypothetical protein